MNTKRIYIVLTIVSLGSPALELVETNLERTDLAAWPAVSEQGPTVELHCHIEESVFEAAFWPQQACLSGVAPLGWINGVSSSLQVPCNRVFRQVNGAVFCTVGVPYTG